MGSGGWIQFAGHAEVPHMVQASTPNSKTENLNQNFTHTTSNIGGKQQSVQKPNHCYLSTQLYTEAFETASLQSFNLALHALQYSTLLLGMELGKYKTVTAILWPWLSGHSPENLSSYSLFAQKRERGVEKGPFSWALPPPVQKWVSGFRGLGL